MKKQVHVVIVDEFKPFFVNLPRVMREIIEVGDDVKMGCFSFDELVNSRAPIQLLDGEPAGVYFLVVEMTEFSIYNFLSIQQKVFSCPLEVTYTDVKYHIIEPVLTAYEWGFDIKSFDKNSPLRWREFTLEEDTSDC